MIKRNCVFMAECLHFVDVEGIPTSSEEKLPLFYQAVCSLILQREVLHVSSFCAWI